MFASGNTAIASVPQRVTRATGTGASRADPRAWLIAPMALAPQMENPLASSTGWSPGSFSARATR